MSSSREVQGVDAHIDPRGELMNLPQITEKLVLCRGDVGIAPYASFDMPVSNRCAGPAARYPGRALLDATETKR